MLPSDATGRCGGRSGAHCTLTDPAGQIALVADVLEPAAALRAAQQLKLAAVGRRRGQNVGSAAGRGPASACGSRGRRM
jgi:hypothetical protein